MLQDSSSTSERISNNVCAGFYKPFFFSPHLSFTMFVCVRERVSAIVADVLVQMPTVTESATQDVLRTFANVCHSLYIKDECRHHDITHSF